MLYGMYLIGNFSQKIGKLSGQVEGATKSPRLCPLVLFKKLIIVDQSEAMTADSLWEEGEARLS